MTIWVVAVLVGVVAAVFTYGRRVGSWLKVALPATLRAAAVALLIALLFDAPIGARRPVAPFVGLDVSSSWLRGRDTSAWTAAVRQAREVRGDSLFLVGDSARAGAPPERPTDRSSRIRPL